MAGGGGKQKERQNEDAAGDGTLLQLEHDASVVTDLFRERERRLRNRHDLYRHGRVGAVDGVERAAVDIDASTVDLNYDGTDTTFAAVVEAIEDVGYEVPAQ